MKTFEEIQKLAETYAQKIVLNLAWMPDDKQREHLATAKEDYEAGYTACQDEDKAKVDIKGFVNRYMKSYGDETFIANKSGVYMASMGGSSINLECFFEDILEDYIEEINGNSQLPNPPKK